MSISAATDEKKQPPGKTRALDVRQEQLAERLQPLQAGGLRQRGDDDLRRVDVVGGVDRRELELLLRAEVREEAALAHPDVLRQAPDREPVEPFDGGQPGGGLEDGGPAARAVFSPASHCGLARAAFHA